MRNIHLVIIYLVLLAIIGYNLLSATRKERTVYVDNLQLFSGFRMKSELEKKYAHVESQRKAILDSLYQEIKIQAEVKQATSTDAFEMLKRQFLVKKEQFDQDNARTREDYNTKIWAQLNEYTRQYGKEHGYDFILGANGQGVLMYADELKNVTPELIQYVNQKFDGQ